MRVCVHTQAHKYPIMYIYIYIHTDILFISKYNHALYSI